MNKLILSVLCALVMSGGVASAHERGGKASKITYSTNVHRNIGGKTFRIFTTPEEAAQHGANKYRGENDKFANQPFSIELKEAKQNGVVFFSMDRGDHGSMTTVNLTVRQVGEREWLHDK